MTIEILLPPGWIDIVKFDACMLDSHDPFSKRVASVRFHIPHDCRLLIDAATMMLSLCNQLAALEKTVSISFSAEDSDISTYLNRIGFFDNLSNLVDVHPGRPLFSGASLYQGNNVRTFEIQRLDESDRSLPRRVSSAIETCLEGRLDLNGVRLPIFTVISELVDNVYQHSYTKLPGFVAFQDYRRGGKIIVSDSGRGIVQTLRSTLHKRIPSSIDSSDGDLMVMAFRRNVSRHGDGHGCGFKTFADLASRLSANLDIRFAATRVRFIPKGRRKVLISNELKKIKGTHISFDFSLDNLV